MLVCLHEHEFSGGKFEIAFVEIEGLKVDLDIAPEQIETFKESGAVYKL